MESAKIPYLDVSDCLRSVARESRLATTPGRRGPLLCGVESGHCSSAAARCTRRNFWRNYPIRKEDTGPVLSECHRAYKFLPLPSVKPLRVKFSLQVWWTQGLHDFDSCSANSRFRKKTDENRFRNYLHPDDIQINDVIPRNRRSAHLRYLIVTVFVFKQMGQRQCQIKRVSCSLFSVYAACF